MANHLSMAITDSIVTLHQRGWSQRRIARELDIDRATVARHLRTHPPDPKPANAPLGSEEVGADSKPANAPLGSEAVLAPSKPANVPIGSGVVEEAVPRPVRQAPPCSGRASDCEPWRQIILTKLDQGLSGQRIFQDLAREHKYPGSYFSVRRFVRRLGQNTPLPFRRLECGPGEEVQVDFGTGAPILAQDKRRRTHVFRMVLSHSRKAPWI